MSLVQKLNSIITNGDNNISNLTKIESPEDNFQIYLDIYKTSIDDLSTDYYGTTYIHPEQWFGDVLDLISIFDYKSNSPIIRLTHLKEYHLVSNNATLIQEYFKDINQAKSFFQDLKDNGKIIIFGSISKVITYLIVGGDYKNCNQQWIIKFSTIDFWFDLEEKRDILLDKILKK